MTRGDLPRRAIAVIDGEHYAPVVVDTLRALADDVVAVVLVGGCEKLRGGESYGVPLVAHVEDAIATFDPEVVLDLSDEPVLGPRERLALAARVLAQGVAYEGADFTFVPPALVAIDRPSIAVVGTGKRVGKTAVTGQLARTLSERHRVVVVAMGRGGPATPEVIRAAPTLQALLELSRNGRHACSDHLETALVAQVETVGCRRCGGGLAGGVVASNVLEGIDLAETLEPDLLVLDGSGAALPPIAASATLLVVGANQDPDIVGGYLNAYRALRADAIVVTLAEDERLTAPVVAAMTRAARPETPIVRAVLRPQPLEPVAGERVAWFGAAPAGHSDTVRRHLEEIHGATVTHVSAALADREALRRELATVTADTFVVELKAAAVDVVAEEAARRDVRVVVAANDVVAATGETVELTELWERLAVRATAQTAEVGR